MTTITTTPSCISKLLQSRLDMSEWEELLGMTSDVASILERANVTYMMFAGTLLGSYRHHRIIPWDVDVDLTLDMRDQTAIENAFRNVSKYILVKYNPPTHWKVNFPTKKFPFVDLFFYRQNGSYIVEPYGEFYQLKTNIYPLIRRPLNGLRLYAPRNTKEILEKRYGRDLYWCRVHDYSCGVDCFELSSWGPIVFRNSSFTQLIRNGSIMVERERLQFKESVLHILDIEIPNVGTEYESHL